MTLHDLVSAARVDLQRAGISAGTAALDADLLARHALGWDRATWLSRRTDAADAPFEQRYAKLIARRTMREPVAYIRGIQEFWGREFQVSPAVLIPRPETELIIEVTRTYLVEHPAAVIVDVGTGSGCIAVTLALEHPGTQVFATDVSEDALAVARANAARLDARDRVRFLHGAYLASAPRPIDLLVSNPPYVARTDWPVLPPEVERHEPLLAWFGGDDGLRAFRAILAQARHALAVDGRLVMEIGYGQADNVALEVAATTGLSVESIASDLQGIPRVMVVRRRRD